ncbi:MAG: response regulator [Nitrospinae bacterium]|nr:response regulator [Nitrospinota bacterium]
MAKNIRILTVDDEEDIQELLRYTLEREGYEVTGALTGEEALEGARANPPGLVLLDLMLPGVNGLEVCRRLRAGSATRRIPIIMLTAKGEEEDIVRGLELGADDYVVKPFSHKVVLARIAAALRRAGEDATASILKIGDLTLDRERYQVSLGGKPLELTQSEFAILAALMAKPGKVMTRRQLISDIRGGEITVTDRSIDVHVTALRKKLGRQGERIVTVRGVGYRFDV